MASLAAAVRRIGDNRWESLAASVSHHCVVSLLAAWIHRRSVGYAVVDVGIWAASGQRLIRHGAAYTKRYELLELEFKLTEQASCSG